MNIYLSILLILHQIPTVKEIGLIIKKLYIYIKNERNETKCKTKNNQALNM